MKQQTKEVNDGYQPTKKLKTVSVVMKEKEIFADPTLDVTFKMLFGQDKNKDILISLLNSLLNFTGAEEIENVEINCNELEVSNISKIKSESGIESAVDVLCTNKGKQKIAIEMQGQSKNYFLTREQEYMCKLISGQVKQGQGEQYHKEVLNTYILVLGKQNMFKKDSISDQKIFEIDVEPRIVQTNQTYPNNKMHWKFYELPKFKKSDDYKHINNESDIKHQWLEFLIDCSNSRVEPDRNKLIKKGYNIMKIATWDEDTQNLYWKQKANELDLKNTIEIEKQEEFNKGLEQGKLKGEIKGEISKFKNFQELKLQEEQYKDMFKHLKPVDWKYIQEHTGDTESQLAGAIMENELSD